MDQFFSVETEQWLGLTLVSLQPMLDNFQVGIIQTILAQGAALNTMDQFFQSGTTEIENGADIQRFLQHLRLMHVARDAIQNEGVSIRMKPFRLCAAVDEFLPEIHR